MPHPAAVCVAPGWPPCHTLTSFARRLRRAAPLPAGSTKREPTVVGKPAEFMLENIATKFGLRREQVPRAGWADVEGGHVWERQACGAWIFGGLPPHK